MISVIIPVYNHERYITATLDSVLLDDTSDVELIVCDDRSKDDSFRVAKSWVEKNRERFKNALVYQNVQNEGIVRTLNGMLQRASGEYIFPIASDDIFNQGYIEKRLASLKRNDIAINRSALIDQNGLELSDNAAWDLFKIPSCNYRVERLLPFIIVLQWSLVGPAPCYRKSVFTRIGGYNENYTVEDREFFLRVVQNKFKIGYIDEPLTRYRVHTSNASRSELGNLRVRREVSRINTDYAPKFDNPIIRAYLRSYALDAALLSKGKTRLYKIVKLLRFSIIYFSILPVCIIAGLGKTNGHAR